MHVQNVQTHIEDGLDQAQIHRLSPKPFPNDVLETVKAKIDKVANKMACILLSNTSLIFFKFQFPMSISQAMKLFL